jgi:hypothetical protein
LLSSPDRDWAGGMVGEIEVVAEVKRKPHRDDSARDKRERTHQEKVLDEALKDTFPGARRGFPGEADPSRADGTVQTYRRMI